MRPFYSYIKSFIFIFGLLFAGVAMGQDFSNKGREFWVLFPPHQPNPGSLANLSLYITSDKNTSGNIIINGVASPFNIIAFQPQEFILDRASTYVSGAESANSSNLGEAILNFWKFEYSSNFITQFVSHYFGSSHWHKARKPVITNIIPN